MFNLDSVVKITTNGASEATDKLTPEEFWIVIGIIIIIFILVFIDMELSAKEARKNYYDRMY